MNYVTKNDYYKWFVFVSLLLGLIEMTTSVKCKHKSDCYNDGRQCATCASELSDESLHCVYLYPDIFEESKECNYKIKCKDDCNNRGKCSSHFQGAFVPFCDCNDSFYGVSCENQQKESAVKYSFSVQMFNLRSIYVNSYDDLTYKVLYKPINGTNPADLMVTALETDQGYYEVIRLSSKRDEIQYIETYKKYVYVFKDPIIYPFKLWDGNKDMFLTNGDKILGYRSTISVSVHISDKELYFNKFSTMVTYQHEGFHLKCVPDIELSNCALSGMAPSLILRSQLLLVSSSVLYVDDGEFISTSKSKPECGVSANFKWDLYLLNATVPKQFIPERTRYVNNYYEFSPYSLDFGLYKLHLLVRAINSIYNSTNHASCYFKVKSDPFIALIDGGNDRRVFKKFGLKLSAMRSKDPNMPEYEQKHMYLQWSCVREDEPQVQDPLCKPKRFHVGESYIIHPVELTYKAVYNFTLTVGAVFTDLYKQCKTCDIKPKQAHLRVEVVSEDDKTPSNIVIACVQNCGPKVVTNQKIFLKAKIEYESQNQYNFKWTYLRSGEDKEQDVNGVTVQGLPSNMLIVRENTFEEGTNYTVLARIESKEGNAKYIFTTDEMTFKEKCEVQPKFGIKETTYFDIKCILPQNGIFIYEFYDKTEDESKEGVIFNGRMLGTSNSGSLQDVKLSRGTVCVYIINNNGLHRNRTIQVKLTDLIVNSTVLEEISNRTKQMMELGDNSKTLQFLSLIPDLINSEFNKSTILNNLLHHVSMVTINTLQQAKLCASTVSNILLTLNKPTQLQLGPHLMERTLSIVHKVAQIVRYYVQNREWSQYLSPNEVTLVAESLLNSLQATLLCKDKSILGIAEDDLDLSDLYKLRDGATSAENIIDHVKDIMSLLQAPGQPPTKLASKGDGFIVWVMKNDVDFNLQKLLELERNIPVVIPDRLQSKLESNTRIEKELMLQAAVIKDNIFWWKISDIKSKLTSVSLARQGRDGKIMKIEQVNPPLKIPFVMHDDLKSTLVQGSVKQLDPNLNPTSLDLAVQVHRLDPIPGSFLSINFIFPSTNNTLRVLLMTNFRPDYEMMVTSPKTTFIVLNNSACSYTHLHRNNPTFFFLGILPGPEVPVNETVTYQFEVNATLCQFWDGGRWVSQGCQMDQATKGKHVLCQCSHLSIFAVAFPVSPQDIDPFADVMLFLTVVDNPLVVGFVSSILLLYLLVCILIWNKDRADRYSKTVIVLDDNFSTDKCPYLLAVFTSTRFNAGTTAHVGFKIYGELSESRSHILTCKYRKVLRKNTDDWFLIFCPEPLGEVLNLHIWHDNSGSSPDWFCKKIFLYDLEANTETLFVVEQWLALRLNAYPEANILPAASHDVLNVKIMFLENFVLGLSENHILLSILFKHPRSHVSRLQRVSIFTAFLMVSMLCSIMFYKPDSDDTAGLDDFQYAIRNRELLVSLECLVISGVVAFVVLFAFGRAHKQMFAPTSKATINIRNDNKFTLPSSSSEHNTIDQENDKQRLKDKSFYRRLVDFISKLIKSPQYAPVQLPGHDSVIQVRRVWLIAAWIICLLIILVSSYLVMLYGLKMGLVNSKKWLTTVFMSLGGDMFVSGPMKLMFFSLILSFAFMRLVVVNTHIVGANDARLSIPKDYGNAYFKKLIDKRSHRMYAPIKDEVREEMLRVKNVRKKWRSLVDFCVSIVFVVIVSAIIFRLWASHYYSSSHVKNLITSYQVAFVASPKFFEVRNILEMDLYLANTLKLSLFRLRWNNGESIETDDFLKVKYWAANGLSKMIGLPSVRQLRVIVVPCQNGISTLNKCLPRWSYSNEDTEVYGLKWTAASWSDSFRKDSPWSYTIRDPIPATLIVVNRLFGVSGRLYDTSGYLVTLGPLREDAERTLSELNKNNWQDPRTRVLFVELTLYNPNEDLFSQVTLIAEYLVSGTVLLKAHVVSLSSSYSLFYLGLLFVCFIVWYLFRSAYLINKLGLLEYLSASVNNVFRLVVVAVGLISIAIYLIHLLHSAQYFKQFQNSGSDVYFDFDAYSYYFVHTKIVLSLLITVAFVRTVYSIRCGRTFTIYSYTVFFSFNWIFWLTSTVVMLIFIFHQLTYLLTIFSLFRVKDLVINKKSFRNVSNLDYQTIGVQVFLFIKAVLLFLVTNLYVIMFKHVLKLTKTYKLTDEDKFNKFSFVKDQLLSKSKRTSSNKNFVKSLR